MDIQKKEIQARGIKFSVNNEEGKEVGRAHLYLMNNGLHEKKPFGFIEDVFVDESLRGQGIGTKLVQKMIEAAKDNNCYKIIMTSRFSKPRVHELYLKLGFKEWGKEFRMDL